MSRRCTRRRPDRIRLGRVAITRGGDKGTCRARMVLGGGWCRRTDERFDDRAGLEKVLPGGGVIFQCRCSRASCLRRDDGGGGGRGVRGADVIEGQGQVDRGFAASGAAVGARGR